MSTSSPRWADLWIIGTTMIGGEDLLPLRLAPIYRDREGRLYLPVAEHRPDAAGPTVVEEESETVEGWFEDGEALRLAVALPASATARLMLLEPGGPPELLEPADLQMRLKAQSSRAFSRAEQLIERGRFVEAEIALGMAARAGVRESLAVAAQLALLRLTPGTDSALILDREEALTELGRGALHDELMRAQREGGLPRLIRFVKEDSHVRQMLHNPTRVSIPEDDEEETVSGLRQNWRPVSTRGAAAWLRV